MIIYYHVPTPSRIDLDHCAMHPTIVEIEKQFQFKGGFEPMTLQLRSQRSN